MKLKRRKKYQKPMNVKNVEGGKVLSYQTPNAGVLKKGVGETHEGPHGGITFETGPINQQFENEEVILPTDKGDYVFSEYLNVDGSKGYNDGKLSYAKLAQHAAMRGASQQDITNIAMDAESKVGNDWENASSIVDRQNVKPAKMGRYVNAYQTPGGIASWSPKGLSTGRITDSVGNLLVSNSNPYDKGNVFQRIGQGVGDFGQNIGNFFSGQNKYQMPSMGGMGGMMNMGGGGGGGNMGDMSMKDMGMGFLNQFGSSWIQNYFMKKQQDEQQNNMMNMMNMMGGNDITGHTGVNQYQSPLFGQGETAEIGGGNINFPNRILGTILENDTLQKIYTDRNISDSTQTSTDTLYYNTNTGNLELYDPINDTTVSVNVASQPGLPFKPDPTKHTQTILKDFEGEEQVSGSGWTDEGFKDEASGNRFRAWMSEVHPEWKSKHKEEPLELIESYNNKYIVEAYNKYEDEYEKFTELTRKTTGVMKNISVPGEELKSEFKTRTDIYDKKGDLITEDAETDDSKLNVKYQSPMNMDPDYRMNSLNIAPSLSSLPGSELGSTSLPVNAPLVPENEEEIKLDQSGSGQEFDKSTAVSRTGRLATAEDYENTGFASFRSPIKRVNQYQEPEDDGGGSGFLGWRNWFGGGEEKIGGTGGDVTADSYMNVGDTGGGGGGKFKDILKKYGPWALGLGGAYGIYSMFKDAGEKGTDLVDWAEKQKPNLIKDRFAADVIKLPRLSDKSLFNEAIKESLKEEDLVSALSVPEQAKYFAKTESSRKGIETLRKLKGDEFQKNLQIGAQELKTNAALLSQAKDSRLKALVANQLEERDIRGLKAEALEFKAKQRALLYQQLMGMVGEGIGAYAKLKSRTDTGDNT